MARQQKTRYALSVIQCEINGCLSHFRKILCTLGKGTKVSKEDSSIYDGDWKYGKRNGFGTLSIPDKEAGIFKKQYSGGWKNDMKHVGRRSSHCPSLNDKFS